MNPIEALQERIVRNLAGAIMSLTRPLHEDGIWSLDVDLAEKRLAIEWSAQTGFGVSSVSRETFGERPDEVLGSLDATEQRVNELLTTSEHSSPPYPVLLSRLREARGFTQAELAERLGVRQATISGFERRGDIQLSTLRRIIEALGGEPGVFGFFPEGTYRIDLSSLDEKPLEPRHVHPRERQR